MGKDNLNDTQRSKFYIPNSFSCPLEKVREITEILGLTDAMAQTVLEKNNWNNENSVSDYLENPNKYNNVPAITNTASSQASGNA